MRIKKKGERKRKKALRNFNTVSWEYRHNSLFFLVAQELQHEYTKFLKINYTDDILNIRCFQKRITDEKLQEFLSSLKKQLEENNITVTRLNLNVSKFINL